MPLYGFGLLGLYGIASYLKFDIFQSDIFNITLLFIVMAATMTLVEFIAGEYCQRILKVKLWDYSNCWGNIDDVICPLFTLFWGVLGLLYYFLIHPHVEMWVEWLNGNMFYTFFIGVFYDVFLVDVIYSGNVINKVKSFAHNNNIIIELEDLKQEIARNRQNFKEKKHFFLSYNSTRPLNEHLNQFYIRKNIVKNKIEKKKKEIRSH